MVKWSRSPCESAPVADKGVSGVFEDRSPREPFRTQGFPFKLGGFLFTPGVLRTWRPSSAEGPLGVLGSGRPPKRAMWTGGRNVRTMVRAWHRCLAVSAGSIASTQHAWPFEVVGESVVSRLPGGPVHANVRWFQAGRGVMCALTIRRLALPESQRCVADGVDGFFGRVDRPNSRI